MCRLLPLLLDIDSLGTGPRRFIERLGRYAAVVLLTIILLNVMAGLNPGLSTHHGLFIGAAGAIFLSMRGLKPYVAFFIGLSIYVFCQVIAQ
ncbi:hypothetical protein DFQ15_11622 [Xylophilus ampelinus]|uniref:Uncharacterized protein n=2 Tax=Xylophilus ampelinus TaxID=54067 RepID=A0A318SKN0_9BURK|nr:hypothetical protein DFQ15_11622 [Xylophilus ampelinus]